MIPLSRIHLDPIGGIAGDMFVAAMVDAFPECEPGLMAELAKLSGGELRSKVVGHHDSALKGSRFLVEAEHHAHVHIAHSEIRARLGKAGLDPAVLAHALALFALLADAEAQVHGVSPDEVEFHEVGAFDSIVDFVAAAYLIATLAPERWSCAPLPLGGGRVKTAHGVLPVPAPATTLLLRGLDVIDDGVGGERVTPTGAAIVKYLKSVPDLGQARARPGPGPGLAPVSLAAIGHGFGTRKLPGMPNVLRCLAFTHSAQLPGPLDEEIATLQFEIDDQTAEDLAVALDRIREAPGVLDAAQAPIHGKKGRLATQVQVLARLDAADEVADLCLSQTTTLGVRIARVWRRTAMRAEVKTHVPEPVRVKVAQRPTGEITAKAEIEDLARIPGDRSRREEARRRAEAQALEQAKPYEPRDRNDD
jgi:pyridinium-3,5-bisthiocarboxylic acid mononucleotide nickel chelatase